MDVSKLKEIANRFDISGIPTNVAPLGDGLINDTFKVTTEGVAPNYVLQRINIKIFPDVELLQNNIVSVTGHIRHKLELQGAEDIDRKVLRFIPLKGEERTWVEVDGDYWRLSLMIENAITKNEVNPDSSYSTGLAFGNFQSMLSDIPDQLGEVIPGFHNMELRSRQLKDAIKADAAGRMADPEVKEIVRFMEMYDEEMTKAERMYREGILPKRICHCDPKVNNILFDEKDNVLCVLDLDTVMPSFIFSDFGDFLRTAANTVSEDDPNFSAVEFRMDIFEAFANGYLETTKAFLTPVERENLPYAAMLFPYMQAARFFADYLNGDTYYKINYSEHNLVRTRNQVALFKSVRAHLDPMNRIIGK